MSVLVQADMAVLARGIVLHTAPHQALTLVSGVLDPTGRVTPGHEADPTWLIDGGRPVVGLLATPSGCVLSVHELAFLESAPQGAQMWEWLRARVEAAAAASGVATSRCDHHFARTQVIDPYTSVWSAAPAGPSPVVVAAAPGWPLQQTGPPMPSFAPAPGLGTGAKIAIALVSVVVGLVILGIVAAIAIPVFLNQQQKAALAEFRALTCTEVATSAVEQSRADAGVSGVALVAMTEAVIAADERAALSVPDAGFQNFVMSCSGSGTWADGIETPLTVDVYIDSQLTLLLEATWDE